MYELPPRSTHAHSRRRQIIVSKKNQQSSFDIKAKPSSTRFDISSSINMRILCESSKRKRFSQCLLLPVEANYEFNVWSILRLIAEKSQAHRDYIAYDVKRINSYMEFLQQTVSNHQKY